IVLEGNPVYDAPADLQWGETQRRAKTVVRLGYYEDESSEKSDWHLPSAHYLESWGDARSSDGTLVAIQPLIEPLFGGLSEIEVLARLAGESVNQAYELVRATFFEIAKTSAEEAWQRFLFEGFLADSAARAVEATVDAAAVAQWVSTTARTAAPRRDA